MIHITKRAFVLLAAAGLLQRGADAQSLSPVLVGSSGSFSSNATFSISSSVGEAVITTVGPVSNTYLTQGFQQPSSTGIQPLTVTFTSNDASCMGANNGYGVAQVMTGKAPFTYQWMPAGGTTVSAFPADTTDLLVPGTYTVTVTDANGFVVTDSVIINDSQNNCDIVIYSGITPNGDGNNDIWHIDFIDLYSGNTVNIFNRWGQRVWTGKDYNNQQVVWEGNNESGQPLPDATYYYVIFVNNKTYTGWVELTH